MLTIFKELTPRWKQRGVFFWRGLGFVGGAQGSFVASQRKNPDRRAIRAFFG